VGIAFIGDTQETLLIERLLGREDNRAESIRLIAAIAQARPTLVVHLGDLVALSTARAWRSFDTLVRPLHGVARVAIRGNHDLWGRAHVVEREWSARFPSQTRLVRAGATAIVLLDSNLRDAAWNEQREWLARTLGQLDGDDTYARVLVCVHHPPRTNSTVTSDDVDVARDLLPAFVASRKTRAMLSGHVHAYEHFEIDGPFGVKHLVVAGGAGGPRVRLHTGARARHVDLCALPSPRPVHSLWLDGDTLEARDVQGTAFDRIRL
jgi:3',5'-cyclic AMP phosphodiesterase CpdA